MNKKMIFYSILLLCILIISGCSENNSTTNKQTEKAPLEVEIGEIESSGTQLRVINRNDYDWHNVKVTVNEYYSCWSRDILKPNEVISVNALTCNQFVINHDIVYSLIVEADEGSSEFAR